MPIYFSRGDGLAASRYVFLTHNGLPQRWAGRHHFIIGCGSRGLVSALLAVERLTDLIDGGPLPLGLDLVQVLHLARFLMRALKRARWP